MIKDGTSYFGFSSLKTRVAVWFSVRYLVLDRHVP